MKYLSEYTSALKKECFDFDWLFSRGDISGAERSEYNFIDWQTVNLPHDFAIEGPFALDEKQQENPQDFSVWKTDNGYRDWQTGSWNGYLPGGIGWYRKSFIVGAEAQGKRIFLEFEGVYRNADIWLNGIHIKNQRNGYLGFHIDITDTITFEGTNLLAVRCDNSQKDTSRWYTGSGIYRHCYLYACDEIYIPHNGISITTPEAGLNRATVEICANVCNTTDAKALCKTAAEIFDTEGQCVSLGTSVIEVERQDTNTAHYLLLVNDPMLWSVEAPRLYRARITLSVEDNIIGVYENTFGIRRIEFLPGKGLLLNGQHIIAKGVNIHHDLGCLGAAAFDSAILRRLKLIKEMGCNAIRLSHNPHAPVLLDMCDRLGILVFAEAFDKLSNQYYGADVDFEEVWQAELQAFLERDRNHPCIFIWSIGNEIEQQRMAADFGIDIVRRMIAFVHQIEPSRKVTCAQYPSREDGKKWDAVGFYESEPAQMTFYTDIMSSNYLWMFFQKDREKYPQLIPLQSEAAVGAEDLGGWTAMDKTGVAGHLFWGGIDYLGESIVWPYKGWYRGFADICGQRRPISYHMEAAFSQRPVAHIGVALEDSHTGIVWNDADLQWKNILSHWNWKQGDRLKLKVYSNQEAVELFLNGQSLGRQTLERRQNYIYQWEIDYQPGTLTAVASTDGQVTATHTLITAETKKQILLEPEQTFISADGQDVVHITVKITDEQGNVCPCANDELHFSVEGAGCLQGVASGDLKSSESYTGTSRKAFMGCAQLVIRPATVPGAIYISAQADNLTEAKLCIHAI